MQSITNKLSEVSETALITLKGRVLDTQGPNPVLVDPVGNQCLERIIPLLPEELCNRILNRKLPSTLVRYLSLRARKYDKYTDDFINQNPDGLVVNLGCGFDTRYWRLAKPPLNYIEIDLPAVIELKQKVLKDIVTYPMIACSILEDKCLEQVMSIRKEKVLFLAEGLFMYLPRDGAIRIFQRLSESFSNSQIVFEIVDEKFTRGLRKKIVQYKMRRYLGSNAGTSYQFGLRNPNEIECFGSNIKVVEQWSYLDDKQVLPRYLHHFRNFRYISRAQYCIRANVNC